LSRCNSKSVARSKPLLLFAVRCIHFVAFSVSLSRMTSDAKLVDR
jgi:hypothetical protein